MGRVLLPALLSLVACGHEKLDFALPDGGAEEHRDGSTSRCRGGSCEEGSSDGADSSRSSTAGPPSQGGGSSGIHGDTGNAGYAGDSGAFSEFPPGAQFQSDPDGYPTRDGHWAPWCEEGQSFTEVCGTDIDEDCDGVVDEFAGIGQPCAAGCNEGLYVCNPMTNALLCRGVQGCTAEQPPPCGDGFVGAGEDCDPAAPGEHPGATCTLSCRRPLFVQCVFSGVKNPDLCDELHVCNERIGACMPVIGPRQPRCPNLRVEGSTSGDEFYPMLETEDGECWVTCSDADQCPSTLSDCYMGFCVVPL